MLENFIFEGYDKFTIFNIFLACAVGISIFLFLNITRISYKYLVQIYVLILVGLIYSIFSGFYLYNMNVLDVVLMKGENKATRYIPYLYAIFISISLKCLIRKL